MIGSSDHDQVAERRGKNHVVAPSVVKRRTATGEHRYPSLVLFRDSALQATIFSVV